MSGEWLTVTKFGKCKSAVHGCRGTQMRYFEALRRTWICDFIAKNGRINRSDIMKEFSISLPQASIDLQRLKAEFPNLVIYNRRSKQYEVPGFNVGNK